MFLALVLTSISIKIRKPRRHLIQKNVDPYKGNSFSNKYDTVSFKFSIKRCPFYDKNCIIQMPDNMGDYKTTEQIKDLKKDFIEITKFESYYYEETISKEYFLTKGDEKSASFRIFYFFSVFDDQYKRGGNMLLTSLSLDWKKSQTSTFSPSFWRFIDQNNWKIALQMEPELKKAPFNSIFLRKAPEIYDSLAKLSKGE